MRIHVSRGNSKLGAIPNISLRPVVDCGNCRLCAKTCYALKAYKNKAWPNVRVAWRDNGLAFRADIPAAIEGVRTYLERRKPRFFRVHVAGDFLNQEHVDAWFAVAREFPGTRFLAFTKMFSLNFRGRPENFTVIYSMWPGLRVPRGWRGPRAWMQDGTEKRVPGDAIECPGNCETCGMCWGLGRLGRDVVFEAH